MLSPVRRLEAQVVGTSTQHEAMSAPSEKGQAHSMKAVTTKYRLNLLTHCGVARRKRRPARAAAPDIEKFFCHQSCCGIEKGEELDSEGVVAAENEKEGAGAQEPANVLAEARPPIAGAKPGNRLGKAKMPSIKASVAGDGFAATAFRRARRRDDNQFRRLRVWWHPVVASKASSSSDSKGCPATAEGGGGGGGETGVHEAAAEDGGGGVWLSRCSAVRGGQTGNHRVSAGCRACESLGFWKFLHTQGTSFDRAASGLLTMDVLERRMIGAHANFDAVGEGAGGCGDDALSAFVILLKEGGAKAVARAIAIHEIWLGVIRMSQDRLGTKRVTERTPGCRSADVVKVS
ncbi:hypothetical protein Efla_002884 [Eimeria flavescens]